MQKLSTIMCGVSDDRDANAIQTALQGIYDRMSSQVFTSAGVTTATTTTQVKIASAINYIAGGISAYKAVTDNFWTLAGTVSNGATNVFCLFIDSTGAASSAMGTEATTVTAGQLTPGVRFPPMQEKKALVGYVIVSCSGGAFTGGSSGVATAGNFTVTFVNTNGLFFDPTAVFN